MLTFLSRISILTRDIDTVILSVRHIPVLYRNGFTTQ